MDLLKGKVAVVTGAARGIGRMIALRFVMPMLNELLMPGRTESELYSAKHPRRETGQG